MYDMVNIGNRISVAPDVPAEGVSSPAYHETNRKSLINSFFESRRERSFFERGKTDNRKTENTGETKSCDDAEDGELKKIQTSPDESDLAEELTNDEKSFESKLNDLRHLRDCVALSVLARVAKFVHNGRNTAKGPIEAWRNASTKALQEKARLRCAGKCRELWEKMEKHKSQVMAIRLENTHYMNNLAREDREKALQSSIIEEEEEETMDFCSSEKSCSDTNEMDESKPPANCAVCVESSESAENAEKSDCTLENDDRAISKRLPKNEVARHDSMEQLTEVKCPNSSPSTIDTESLSTDGDNDSIGSADVLTDTEINALSMSDDICAIQRSTIDFALAIIDCDVVLVDIDTMQSLILAAERAINALVFKAVQIPAVKRTNSAKVIQSHIATVSKRASSKMNAIQRAIAKVDKHRQKQRLVVSR